MPNQFPKLSHPVFKIHCNIILQSTLKSFKRSVLLQALLSFVACVLYFALVTLSQYSTEVLRVAQLVETLHYKLEGRGFDSR